MSILHPSTAAAASRKGYRLQVNQHAPVGYNNAYSVDIYNGYDEHVSEYYIGRTPTEARESLSQIVRGLKP